MAHPTRIDSKTMRIFVTGAAGFVGRAVVLLLLRHGHYVDALVRGRSFQRMPYRRRLRLIEGDLLEPSSWQGRARVADAIVHLANDQQQRHFGKNAMPDQLHQGTLNLIEAAVHSNREPPRFICVSYLGSQIAAQSDLLRHAAEKEAIVRHGGVDHLILRSAPMFGPGDRFVTAWARWLRFSPIVPVTDSGSLITLQPIAVRNVVEAIVKAVKQRSLSRREYDVAGPRIYAVPELVQVIGMLIRRKHVRCWPVSADWYRRWANLFAGSACFPFSGDQWDAWEEIHPCNPLAFFRDFCIRPIQLAPDLLIDSPERTREMAGRHMTP